MRHSGVIVFIAVCASAIPSSRSQDFSSCRNLSTDITGCSTEFLQGISTNGLFTDFTKGFNLTSAISGSFCQSSTKTAILDFYGCIYEKLLACLSSDWQKVLPSLDQRKQSFDYMCDNINDVDLTCVGTTENAGALLNCLKQGTKGGFNLSTPDGYLAFVCSASQLYESCTKTAYGSCPKRTAEVLVEIDKLTRPAGCDACVSQPSLLLLASVLAFMMALFK
ncbi:uncharacterized protein LOC124273932 isoform X2 [Haliotis rubra]|uniref:uncharacterized protein LOC124273932 isoform X2 n=1 Tax=Haliotis rubra TaxID=36100 RepID=UPI001EE601E1|nr:uncharacterized protein LOC124273932 isoform X2 [Haliotis rubra]